MGVVQGDLCSLVPLRISKCSRVLLKEIIMFPGKFFGQILYPECTIYDVEYTVFDNVKNYCVIYELAQDF